jgi:hypothetical protein
VSQRVSIEEMLAEARAGLDRVPPEGLTRERSDAALVVDIRPIEQRDRDGELPGSVVIDRNVLERRLDPSSLHRIAELTGYGQRIVTRASPQASQLPPCSVSACGARRTLSAAIRRGETASPTSARASWNPEPRLGSFGVAALEAGGSPSAVGERAGVLLGAKAVGVRQ